MNRLAIFALALLTVFGLTALPAAQPSGANFYPVYNVTHISTNTTTTAMTGAGVLRSLCVADQGASANTATVYDNTAGSGDVIAVVDTVTFDGCLELDARITTGITVVTATGTAGDLVLTYRAI